MSAPIVTGPGRAESIKLGAVTLVWLGMAGWLDRVGNVVVPDEWKRHVPFQTFLMACQITAAAVGLGLSVALLAHPRAALALVRPRARQLVLAALLAPGVFVLSAAVALRIALPVLLAEARVRGPQASRANAGAFGRALGEGSLLPTLLWGVVLAAVTEELLFRGALFSLLERAARAVLPGPGGRWVAGGRAAGLVAAVGAAVVFALMHGDLRGGVGLVRIVSTLCLGLACGVARHAAGTVAAPIVVHLVHNAIAVGQARRWFASASPPLFEALPLPSPVLGLAALGLGTALVLAVALAVARRRAQQERALHLDG
jgi:membrane protease YdiL (CAAX protease family)